MKAKKAQLEAAASRRAAKKAAVSIPNTKLGQALTDDEYIEYAKALVDKRILTATSSKLVAKLLDIQNELNKSNVNVALVRNKLAALGENLDDAYSQSRKDVAMWAQDPMDADKRLSECSCA